ncbi:pyridoxamine 5'-phosphate oxidase family protein [Couchioplanes caeruleus]|uniref:Pyridoxamine 5'-phosphate oxidase n=2 Tax=Couchioplanes caeruleus TaxID=56438 RepID=A0A1K0GC10_9ACTN|nr:pyridoxamine 5'-phosphate oxidase family protein [Couchioplanes caeruleus]OJF14778.1 pyridoxamine 5'-phosphate oxidase [Couchioplanes caeruleus subsp. caeruleus]ROP28069.1 nitroimidazol reductase NimA-like FMN-containing flavoprotein (pyridoxamine 5'-phosphate oxidase superfamily) [Couchioplanes caeruleus]
MPLTNPWLSEPSPERRLDRERLEERILNLLSSQNMCVLATAGPAGPLATPVRYYPLDFAVMFTAAPRSPKMRNIAADPRVSVGIFAPLVGLASSRGAQLFGTARVLPAGHPDRAHYWPAFRWENEHAERGRPLSEPPADTLVVIEAERIVYTEHWLRRENFAARQFWRRSRSA